MTRRATVATAMAALLAWTVPALTACRTTPAGEAPRADAVVIHSGESIVRKGRVEDVFLLTGELHAVESLDLVTPRSENWQVQIKWLADDGADLHAGDRAIEFENSQIPQTIEDKKLRLIQSEIELESREPTLAADAEEKTFAFERAKTGKEKARVAAAIPQELMERRKWQENQNALRAAEAALEKARLDLEAFRVSSKADLEVLRIAREKARRDIDSAQHDLQALALKAPRDGIFVVGDYWREERKFQVGDSSWPGQTIASIPDLSVMEVVAYLPEVDDGRIAPGMRARCILDTYPDRIFEGTVKEVASIAAEEGRRTRGGFRVGIALDSSDPALMRPGMSVRAEIIGRAWDQALTVPKHAIRREAGRAYVVRAGGSSRTEVRLAACTPTDCIIESGISEGERVALR